jgi:hypothetical protein
MMAVVDRESRNVRAAAPATRPLTRAQRVLRWIETAAEWLAVHPIYPIEAADAADFALSAKLTNRRQAEEEET